MVFITLDISIKSISDCENINSVNPVYMIGEVEDILKKITEINTFASTDKHKNVIEKYTKIWDEIKYIQTINAGKSGNMKKITGESNLIQMMIYH